MKKGQTQSLYTKSMAPEPQNVSTAVESSETLRNLPWLHFSNVWQGCKTLSLPVWVDTSEVSELTTNLEQDQQW